MMMKQSLPLLRSAIVDARAVKPPLEAISLLAHSEGEKKKALPPGEFHREARLIAHPPLLPSGCFCAIEPLRRTFSFVRELQDVTRCAACREMTCTPLICDPTN